MVVACTDGFGLDDRQTAVAEKAQRLELSAVEGMRSALLEVREDGVPGDRYFLGKLLRAVEGDPDPAFEGICVLDAPVAE